MRVALRRVIQLVVVGVRIGESARSDHDRVGAEDEARGKDETVLPEVLGRGVAQYEGRFAGVFAVVCCCSTPR